MKRRKPMVAGIAILTTAKAPILLAANDGRFPRWLGALAAVFAVEQLVETITIIGPPGSFIAPGGAMNVYLGGPLFIAFFLALGIALSLDQPGEVQPTQNAADAGPAARRSSDAPAA